jgi:hypothetical protein
MRWIGKNLGKHNGKVVDNGQCVRYLQIAARVPHTSTWHRGECVRDAEDIEHGTAIATFSAHGKYTNSTNGASHAAFFLAHQDDGLLVSDQWKGQPVHNRVVRYKGGVGTANNDGDRYFIIETDDGA